MNASVMKIPRRTWIGILIAGLLIVVFLIPVLRWEGWFLYFRIRERISRVAFESESWKTYRRAYGVSQTNYWAFKLPIRLRMIDDLMARHDLDGKTRKDVVALLGEKDKTPYFSEWDLVYFLGPGRFGDAIGDSEWLVIRFTPDGKVSDYRVVHD